MIPDHIARSRWSLNPQSASAIRNGVRFIHDRERAIAEQVDFDEARELDGIFLELRHDDAFRGHFSGT